MGTILSVTYQSWHTPLTIGVVGVNKNYIQIYQVELIGVNKNCKWRSLMTSKTCMVTAASGIFIRTDSQGAKQ